MLQVSPIALSGATVTEISHLYLHPNLNTMTVQELEKLATQIRRDIVRMVHGVQSGHPGGSLGCTDFLTALYFDVMKRNASFTMDGVGEDLFFLSNGHISPLFYSVLARAGYFEVKELASFRKINSRLQGHPTTHEHLPGVRIASGSLGQGISVALGAALAKKLNNDNSIVYCLTGDGELNEGQNWEAIMAAAHHKVDNLIVTVDWNGQQIDGSTTQVMNLGDLEAKFTSFGWKVVHMNGNDMAEVLTTLTLVSSVVRTKSDIASSKGQPTVVLMKTEMGKGVSFMEGSHEWHGIAPSDAQLAAALEQLPETIGDY